MALSLLLCVLLGHAAAAVLRSQSPPGASEPLALGEGGGEGCAVSEGEKEQLSQVLTNQQLEHIQEEETWYRNWVRAEKANGTYLLEVDIDAAANDPVLPSTLRRPDKFVYFFRHADADCNADGGLTEKGRKTARALFEAHHEEFRDIALIFSSPMTRSIETALEVFKDAYAAHHMILDPDLMEVGNVLNYKNGKKLLEKKNRQDLLTRQYDHLWGDQATGDGPKFWTGSDMPSVRWNNFYHRLLARREEKIAVFSHAAFMEYGIKEHVGTGKMSVRELHNHLLIPRKGSGWRHKNAPNVGK